jgi:hypothetical protein
LNRLSPVVVPVLSSTLRPGGIIRIDVSFIQGYRPDPQVVPWDGEFS